MSEIHSDEQVDSPDYRPQGIVRTTTAGSAAPLAPPRMYISSITCPAFPPIHDTKNSLQNFTTFFLFHVGHGTSSTSAHVARTNVGLTIEKLGTKLFVPCLSLELNTQKVSTENSQNGSEFGDSFPTKAEKTIGPR